MVDHVDLDVHAGEIVALAGVQGNGQTEFAEAVAGLREVASGTVMLEGQDVTSASPRDRIRAGLADVPEDRQKDGLVLPMSVADNLVLDIYDVPPPRSPGSPGPRRGEVERAAKDRRLRHPDVLGQRGRRGAVRRQPAKGRSSPASCRVR